VTKQLEGKVAVVAGGASGIGRACAVELMRRGAEVAVLDVNDAAGLEVEMVRADVSSPPEVEAAARRVLDRFGGIDILVNSAGIQRYGNAVETAPDVWDEVLAVNLRSMYLTARAFLPSLTARRGAIVNVGSVQSLGALPGAVAYVASKHGVLGLTRGLAIDHAPDVRVNCVAPGSIDTPMLRGAATTADADKLVRELGPNHPLGRVGEPEEVARLVAFLAGPEASFITGACVTVDGGIAAGLRFHA